MSELEYEKLTISNSGCCVKTLIVWVKKCCEKTDSLVCNKSSRISPNNDKDLVYPICSIM